MPGRKYSAGSSYRYGFNGKEDDNDVKNVEGGQQDYGMRIYDPRVGRFLSVDPLAASYPWYTPYQFSGNDVIRCIDLEGGEPLSRTGKWDKNTTFLKVGSGFFELYDKTSHVSYQAMGIKDPTNGTMWIVAEDQHGQNKWFYLKNDDGATDKVKYYIENGRNVLYKSHFEKFETQNEKERNMDSKIADGFSYMAVGIVAAPVILEVGTTATTAKLTNVGVDYISQVIGNYISGKRGFDAAVGNINLTSLAVSFVNPGSTWKKLLFNNTVSSFASITAAEGYNGVGNGKDPWVALMQTATGTIAGRLARGSDLRAEQLAKRLEHVKSLFGETSPLATSLQSMLRNTTVVGTVLGATSGASGNAVNNKLEEKKD